MAYKSMPLFIYNKGVYFMKKILMIGTGGTIASKHSENGLTPGLSPSDILSYIPAVEQVCHVDTLQICSIDSTNVTPEHWNLMVKTIEDNYDNYDGFVICHGTDTLAYTGAALSYMIQNSNKPIVITGSQKPIDLDVTDARTNLLDSFIYASYNKAQDVNIVFDGKVIAGTRAKKDRAKSYNAFSSINFPYIAVIQDGMIVQYIDKQPFENPVQFHYDMEESVIILKIIPGMKPDILEYVFEKYDCIIIESFGVGGIPATMFETLYSLLEKWNNKGKFVIMTTQVANEGSNMAVYEVGKKIKQDFNMIEAHDMTLEATLTKLMWLMSMPHTDEEKLRSMFYKTINHDILFTTRAHSELK